MSQQVQYNYYNTLATKINDTTFIFRGKTNVPNLRIQASLPDTGTSDYISTKLTINPSEGTIEIEHEPITNYSKKVIVTIPLHLDIGSDSKEINLNSMIPKSIRFKIDETENAIYLHPDTGGSSYKEGLTTTEIADAMSEMECSPIDATGIEKKNLRLLSTTPAAEGTSQKMWTAIAAAAGAGVFAGITYFVAPIVYASIVTRFNPPVVGSLTYAATKVLKIEFWILFVMCLFAIFIALFFTGYKRTWQKNIIGMSLGIYLLFIAISLFSIYIHRKDKLKDVVAIDDVNKQTSQYGPDRGMVWFNAIRT